MALEDGVLKLGLGDGPKGPMTPISETTFFASTTRIEFVKND